MQRFHVKKDDVVVVISGTERGKEGKILAVLPDKQRVIVEGRKMIKRHMKKGRSAQTQQRGAIIEREGTIHISNVMLKATYDARRAKRGATPPAPTQA